MSNSYAISYYAQQVGSLFILLLGVASFSNRSTQVKLLALYGINSLFFQVISTIIINSGNANIFLNRCNNLYVLFEALILFAFFYSLFRASLPKKLIVILGVVYTISYFILMPNHWTEFVSSIRTIRDLMIIICSLLYFYLFLKEMPTTEITKYPLFWIVAAMLFFFAGTFVLSLSLNYLVKVLHNDLSLLWTMRNYFRFLFCLVVCYGLWLDLRSVKAKLTSSK